MKGLFIKDFSYIKESKLLFLFLILFGFGSSYFYKKPTFVLGYFSIFPSIILMSTISYDSINHGFTSLFTLPIKKEDYLKQKYSLGILLGLLFLFFAICISSIGYYRIQQSFYFLNSDFIQELEKARKTEPRIPYISIGCAKFNPKKEKAFEAIERADKDLYFWKEKLKKKRSNESKCE